MKQDLSKIFGSDHGLDGKSVDFLTNALNKNNLPGFDYLEFKLALSNMAAINMEESTAIKSAFATASTMGLTKDKLLKTADHYKKILMDEKGQFEKAMENQMKNKVSSKKQEIEKMKVDITKLKNQIKELEHKLAEYNHNINNGDAIIQETINKIEQTRDSFEHTHNSILNQINKDIEQITQFL